MKTLHHPTLPATVEVPDKDVDAWTAAGWLEPGDVLRGKALDEALEAAGLPKTGTANEKRARLAAHADA